MIIKSNMGNGPVGFPSVITQPTQKSSRNCIIIGYSELLTMNEGSSIKDDAQTSSSKKLIAGSKQCPYKLAVIGGGPSGCSIIIRAFRIGFGGELCGFCTRKPAVDKDGLNIIANAEFPFQSAGVVLVDEGKLEKFGGGKLQDYIINANTWANKFVTNVMDDKPDVLPQESMSNTPFQRLNNANTAVTLKGFGCKPAPLQMVGAFLRDAGSVVQEVLNTKYPDSSRCMLETSVTSLQQVLLSVPNEFRNTPAPTTAAEAVDQLSDLESCVGWKLSLSQKSCSAPSGKLVREIYAHKVVLATGGRQELPRLPNPAHTRKLMSSDYICTQKGLDELRNRLVKAGVTSNRTTPGRVVIIGGSHSAFSAAWLCLHRLSDSITSSSSGVTSQSVPASSDCKAAAGESKAGEETLAFCQSGICMVHKSSIKVFYCTKGDADRDGYVIDGLAPASSSSTGLGAAPGSAAKASQVSKSWIRGQVHPFGGLRGDAKELWRAARDGRETRLKLIQVRQNVATVSGAATGLGPNCQPLKQQAIVEKLFEEAVVIVWACGYSSNLSMPVLDLSGAPVAMRIKGGQVEVDDHARIISASAHAVGVVTAAPILPVLPSPVTTATPLPGLLLPSTLLRCASAEAVLLDDGVEEAKAAAVDPNTGSPFGSPLRTSFKTQTSCRIPDSPSAALRESTVLASVGTPVALHLSAGNSPLGGLPTPTTCLSPMPAPFAPTILTASPSLPPRTSSSIIVKAAQPPVPVIEGLLGSGLGFGLQALLETGMPDGSSGRADGVAVYLKRGATLVLAQVLGNRVFGGPDVKSWEDRLRLIKKIQLVANAAKNGDSASATIGPGGLSSSLDSGSSLLASPSNRRPNTTAGVRNSFSFGSPSSKENSARPGGGGNNVIKRAVASRETPTTVEKALIASRGSLTAVEKAPAVSSAKTSTSASSSSRKASAGSLPFPLVLYDTTATTAITTTSAAEQQKNDTTVSSPHRPSTVAVPVSANSNSSKSPHQPATLEPATGLTSPQSKIDAIKLSPEALRCAELVDKVALLSHDCEQLQFQRAKEFLSVPAGSDFATDATLIVAAPTVYAGGGKCTQSPPVAHPAAVSTKPPIPLRDSSSSRSRARTAGRILPEKPHSNALMGTPKPTVNARVVLTPLGGGSVRSGTGSTPQRNRGNSVSSNSSSSSTPRRTRAPPARPQSTVTTSAVTGTVPVVAAGTGVQGLQAAVLRSNSLGGSTSVAANTTKTTGNSAALNTTSNSNRKQQGKTGGTSPIQPKNMRLELPSIPLHKRSQNQNDDPASRGRAESISKEPTVLLAEKLFKPSTVTPTSSGNSTKIVV